MSFEELVLTIWGIAALICLAPLSFMTLRAAHNAIRPRKPPELRDDEYLYEGPERL